MTKRVCPICHKDTWDVSDLFWFWVENIGHPREPSALRQFLITSNLKGDDELFVTCQTCGYFFALDIRVIKERSKFYQKKEHCTLTRAKNLWVSPE